MENNEKNTSTTNFQEENNHQKINLSNSKLDSLKENNLNIKQEEPISIINQLELKNNLFPINRKIRYFIYIIELLILTNLDQGSISVSTKEIKTSFKMSDRELGSFGGISFLGTTIGGIISLLIINKINRKYLILSFISLNIISLYIPTIISSKILLIICRIITGFAQSFMSIYISVWVDQFGIYNKKSIMMSITSIPSGFGYLMGNIIAVFTSWKITFLINVILFIIYFICLLFLKDLYFLKNVTSKKMDISQNTNNSINKIDDDISLFEDAELNNNNNGNDSIIKHAKICFKSKLFCFSTMSLITLLLISSGIQFWINDFLENSVHILDKKERLLYFIIIILVTMFGSPIICGIIMQKLGGYHSYKCIFLPFYCCIISLIFTNLLFIFSYKIIMAILIGGYLFSGCIMISSLNGIIISSIPKEYTGSASSISNLLYNILGRLVGPYFYGVLRSIFGNNSKLPMIILLNIKFITLFCLYKCFKYKKRDII